ncbi:hypothetical protein MHYMCMPSP_00319 [Hyalomma marginatum]|uniref:Uncharacterized protein n=1 Tax=Hyalomma marginatum TaxID=34627 RepID=A0A8S4BWK5_9ACAR|nr:hypothetical protein MHYMCMPSP_00319 [Hyalomma marginatum]CAG7594221.1 hypothetical protein MHYMCMPASI_00742 [Hyalomma marginatum]
MVLKKQGNHSLNFMTNKKDNFIIEQIIKRREIDLNVADIHGKTLFII